MFGLTYTETVKLRRPVKGTLGVDGSTQYEKPVHADDASDVEVRCKIQERGRVTLDARQTSIRTDATLLYQPTELVKIQTGDFVVRADGAAYEVVGIEAMIAPWGGPPYARVDLVKTAKGVLHG